MTMPGYEMPSLFYGDLHSHCDIGYGHGSIEEAYQNARLQLDFACITPHAWWPDMPEREPRLEPTVTYHRRGFARTAEAWTHLLDVVARVHEPGRFISFPGFEWHSMAYGDHHVVYAAGDLQQVAPIHAADVEEIRRSLRAAAYQGVAALLIPHHIGYSRGYRGINWDAFTPEFSPVVEIMSMHGCSESDETPYPMLHTMGPRDGVGTYHHGLQLGHIVGAVGSTDHHSAHPGSYGHGRVAVWADALTRDSIFQALRRRRCYALTGDRIALEFTLNGASMGAILPSAVERRIAVAVCGGAALETVEVIRNGDVIHRWSPPIPLASPLLGEPVKVCLELGWGPKGEETSWNAEIIVRDGRLLGIEPRLKGPDVVEPQLDGRSAGAQSRWERTGESSVVLVARTFGNPATTTSGTQAISLEIAGDLSTVLQASINGKSVRLTWRQLLEEAHAGYLGGFLTPAYRFDRAVPHSRFTCQFEFTERVVTSACDWYTVRVKQFNNQWAWSSPVWVEGGPAVAPARVQLGA